MTAKGGIGVMSERWTEKSVYGGMLSGGVSIRYNTVKNTPGGEYVSMSEVPATHGIYIHTKGVENVVEQVGDIRFTIVEGNTVDTSEYGVYIDNRPIARSLRAILSAISRPAKTSPTSVRPICPFLPN